MTELDEIDRLWMFAQIERGVETSLDRPALVGSRQVIQRIADEQSPITAREMFNMQYDMALLGFDGRDDDGR